MVFRQSGALEGLGLFVGPGFAGGACAVIGASVKTLGGAVMPVRSLRYKRPRRPWERFFGVFQWDKWDDVTHRLVGCAGIRNAVHAIAGRLHKTGCGEAGICRPGPGLGGRAGPGRKFHGGCLRVCGSPVPSQRSSVWVSPAQACSGVLPGITDEVHVVRRYPAHGA